MITIAPKINTFQNIQKNSFNTIESKCKLNLLEKDTFQQKSNPSFCANPEAKIIEHADDVIKQIGNVFDSEKISEIAKGFQENLKNFIKTHSTAQQNDPNVSVTFLNDLRNVVPKLGLTDSSKEGSIRNMLNIKTSDGFSDFQKSKIEEVVNIIKLSLKKWNSGSNTSTTAQEFSKQLTT